MGYLKIPNLYNDDRGLRKEKECYAMEKIDGTCAHVSWNARHKKLGFFAGGSSYATFVKLFDEQDLLQRFIEYKIPTIIIYGEAYGSSVQKMSRIYGKKLKFIAFDIWETKAKKWWNVPEAAQLVLKLDLEFVHYVKISTDLKKIDEQRDTPSEQAKRNGMGEFHIREGVVLRPLEEKKTEQGERMIVKHKRDEFRETATPRKVDEKQPVLTDAKAIAEEWVTEMRLNHVLQKIPEPSLEKMKIVIDAMVQDILLEGKSEIVDSIGMRKQVARKTCDLFKKLLKGGS